MKRIDISYGGDHYSVGGRQLEDLQQEIAAGLRSGVHWLQVNEGEGKERAAYLLLTPGVPIAVMPVPDDSPVSVTDQWNPEDVFET